MTDPIHAYLLLDTSASMTGAPLEALKQGLQLLCGTFIARCTRSVHISLIGYESAPRVITALQPVGDYTMPTLDAAGSSGLGGAFRLLANTMPENTSPLVYVFTDGEPTDDWEIAIEPLRARVRQIVGIGCGPTANMTMLSSIADPTFQMRELTPDLLYDTFRALV
jgi:uncharacterized protein YegL